MNELEIYSYIIFDRMLHRVAKKRGQEGLLSRCNGFTEGREMSC